MKDLFRIGKLPPEMMEKIIYPKLGTHQPNVLVGPGHGLDNAVIKLGNGQVLILTADPLSIIPALGVKDSAWLSVHLLASDLATCGFPPQFIVVNLCLPPSITDSEFEEYWEAFHEECEKLGIAIIGGHTGRYMGCDYTIVGGGTMLTIAPEDKYLSSNMARPGDLLVMTKGVAIASTGILARVFPEAVENAYGSTFLKRAQEYFHMFSVVDEALAAASVGLRDDGVTAMHDVTEGGLLGAVYELTEASGVGVEIDLSKAIITEEARLMCELFKVDPYATLSEGTLLISVRPHKVGELLKVLEVREIRATVLGRILDAKSGRWMIRNGVMEALKKPSFDPYWEAFWKASRMGWR